jgi:hypothetical protein
LGALFVWPPRPRERIHVDATLVPAFGGALRLLYPPLYAREDPELFGFPFFYWYQFGWVPLTAALTFFVYRKTRTVERPAAARTGRFERT